MRVSHTSKSINSFYHTTTICLILCTRRRNSNDSKKIPESIRSIIIYTIPIVYYPKFWPWVSHTSKSKIIHYARHSLQEEETATIRKGISCVPCVRCQTRFDQKVRTHDVQKMFQRESHHDRIPQVQINFFDSFNVLLFNSLFLARVLYLV